MKIARFLGASVVTAGILSAANAGAAEITVTHWGTQFYGAPFSVAFDKGWFEGECGEVDGVLTSTGGGTSAQISVPVRIVSDWAKASAGSMAGRIKERMERALAMMPCLAARRLRKA